jgi:hypothetical protein
MKNEHIILRLNRGTTRDLYNGTAAMPMPPIPTIGTTQSSIRSAMNLQSYIRASLGNHGVTDQFPPTILPNPTYLDNTFFSRDLERGLLSSESLSVEVRNIDRALLPEITSNSSVIAVAPSMPIRLIRNVDLNRADTSDTLLKGEVSWGVQAVGADTSPFSGEGVVVAVLDTGIYRDHPAFDGIELIEKDFTGEGNGDTDGHGTHCAGTIFGRSHDFGRIGIAPGVQKALIGKIIGKKQGGSSKTIASAIQWAIENGANVISMSVGIDFPGYVTEITEQGYPLEIAVSRALEGYRANVQLFERLAAYVKTITNPSQATVLIAAAGNEADRRKSPDYEVGVSPPANAEGFISVGAVGIVEDTGSFDVAFFSNTGPNVSAPGVNIFSAKVGGGLVAMSGTSMATPHVAGVAALWAEKLMKSGMINSSLLTAKILASATTSELKTGYDPFDLGAGIVQAPQSLPEAASPRGPEAMIGTSSRRAFTLPTDFDERQAMVDGVVKDAIRDLSPNGSVVVKATLLGPAGLGHGPDVRRTYHPRIRDGLGKFNAVMNTLTPNSFANESLLTVGDICDMVNDDIA